MVVRLGLFYMTKMMRCLKKLVAFVRQILNLMI